MRYDHSIPRWSSLSQSCCLPQSLLWLAAAAAAIDEDKELAQIRQEATVDAGQMNRLTCKNQGSNKVMKMSWTCQSNTWHVFFQWELWSWNFEVVRFWISPNDCDRGLPSCDCRHNAWRWPMCGDQGVDQTTFNRGTRWLQSPHERRNMRNGQQFVVLEDC